MGATTAYVDVCALGLKIGVLRSSSTGEPLGSLAIQTVIGSKDSRFVVKIGNIKYGDVGMRKNKTDSDPLFVGDLFRFRIRWNILEITLIDTESSYNNQAIAEANSSIVPYEKSDTTSKVANIVFYRFTVDFQRIFKDDENLSYTDSNFMTSPERSQLTVMIKSISIIDCSHELTPTDILSCISKDKNFFDLCIRTRGSEDRELVRVDLFDLNLAYAEGLSDKIIINGNEEFIWYLLDIANRTAVAKDEIAGSKKELKWVYNHDGYSLFVDEVKEHEIDAFDADGTYAPPKSDILYDVRLIRVSPVSFLFSFKRQPQSSRYQEVRNIPGAKMVNYFTTSLKFTVDKADLKFEGYVVKNLKGKKNP